MAEITIRARNRGKESPGLNREAGSAVAPSGGAAAVVLWTILRSTENTDDYQICTIQRRRYPYLKLYPDAEGAEGDEDGAQRYGHVWSLKL